MVIIVAWQEHPGRRDISPELVSNREIGFESLSLSLISTLRLIVTAMCTLRYDTINVNGHTNLRLTLNMHAPIPPDPWVSRC